MKTNAGQLSALPLFRDLIAERGEDASDRPERRSAWGGRNQSHGEPRILTLAPGEVLNLSKQFKATRVAVEQGILWITGNPDPEDTLLSAGDTMELVGPGMFVAQALNATTVRVWR